MRARVRSRRFQPMITACFQSAEMLGSGARTGFTRVLSSGGHADGSHWTGGRRQASDARRIPTFAMSRIAIAIRVAARTSNTADSSTTNIGFRCVRDVAT